MDATTHTLTHGGGTFHADGTLATLSSGYMVGGIPGAPVRKVPAHDVVAVLGAVLATFTDLTRVTRRRNVTDLYVGTWIDDDGMVWVEYSQHVDDGATALAMAADRGELAIWDVARGECVDLAEPLTHLCDDECGDESHPRDGRIVTL